MVCWQIGLAKSRSDRIVVAPDRNRRIETTRAGTRCTQRRNSAGSHGSIRRTFLTHLRWPKSVSTSARCCWSIRRLTRMRCGRSNKPSNPAAAVRRSRGSMNRSSQPKTYADSSWRRGAAKRLTILFRPATAVQRQSMAELRILMQPASASDRLSIEILKRRGGWPVERLALELAYRTTHMTRSDLRDQLALWRTRSLRSVAPLRPPRLLHDPHPVHVGP